MLEFGDGSEDLEARGRQPVEVSMPGQTSPGRRHAADSQTCKSPSQTRKSKQLIRSSRSTDGFTKRFGKPFTNPRALDKQRSVASRETLETCPTNICRQFSLRSIGCIVGTRTDSLSTAIRP
jgi:hypothetical protein